VSRHSESAAKWASPAAQANVLVSRFALLSLFVPIDGTSDGTMRLAKINRPILLEHLGRCGSYIRALYDTASRSHPREGCPTTNEGFPMKAALSIPVHLFGQS